MILAEDHTWTHKPPVLLFIYLFILHDFLVVLNRKSPQTWSRVLTSKMSSKCIECAVVEYTNETTFLHDHGATYDI